MSTLVNNPLNAFGYTEDEHQTGAEVTEFKAGGTIVAGEIVGAVMTSGQLTVTVGDDPIDAVGVALTSAAAGEIVKVVTKGPVKVQCADAAIGVGDWVSCDASGHAALAAAAAIGDGDKAVGYLLEEMTTGGDAGDLKWCYVQVSLIGAS